MVRVQLKILCGNKAGVQWTTRHFPVRIGRAATADLQLEEPGVWDRHLRIDFRSSQGFILRTEPEALVQVNGESLQETMLRNGDTIQIGALKLQFWLGETRQSSLKVREAFSWALVMVVSLAQVALIYWLLR
jgi:pSer/pThr/pTyr-binding forkhead associated (FHA) protein